MLFDLKFFRLLIIFLLLIFIPLPIFSAPCNIDEDFSDNTADNWTDDSSGAWSAASGVYQMSAIGGNVVRYTYHSCECSNFTYEAQVRKTAGDPYGAIGIYFRSEGTYGNNEYVFRIILAARNYSLVKNVEGSQTYLTVSPTGWIQDDAIHQGLVIWNTLKVTARGDTIKIYCNDTLLGTFTDTSHQSGKVGLMLYDLDADIEAEFDNIELNSYPDASPQVPMLLLPDE